MRNSSNRLSISPKHPIDPLTLQVLKILDELLRAPGIPYMLVGATARDLHLHHVYGFAVVRGTYDLDFAIAVDTWDDFAELKRRLLSVEGFKEAREPHRFLYRSSSAKFSVLVDVIPFGRIEATDHTIAWPPDGDIVMNMAAFSDVLATALFIEVDPGVFITVPSLAGLVILKMFAWLDRRDTRDVSDIRRILETYTDAGNFDRLYAQEADELERVAFDTVLAGAYLLGKDAKLILDEETRRNLSEALTAAVMDELVQQIARAMSTFEDRTEEASALLKGFIRGLGIADGLR